jgi:acyl-[acyl-carrier-protein]-phospholipid O-acyltransferase/long-chain-fatty-acid--[acyl-carrier-protein] ligase
MGAANDNILKTLLSFAVVRGMWEGKLGPGGQGLIALCLFLPFILFSGWAGPLADRYSKRSIAVTMKWIEIPLAVLGGIGFLIGNFWLTAIAMLALATQSTFFGPAKYGMIPEIVAKDSVSKANGLLNMFTNIAVIAGMLIAGMISVQIQDDGVKGVYDYLPGIALLGVAVLGLLAIMWLPALPPVEPNTKIPVNGFTAYITTIKEMCKSPLIYCAIAWANFYLLATVALLVVVELGVLLDVNDQKVSYLLAAIGVSVGLGSLFSGFMSRNGIRIKLSRVGAVLMSASLFVAGILPVSYALMLTSLILMGFFAGMYAVPIQSLMQLLPKPESRGRILATANAISFAFMAVGSLLYWACRPLFNDSPQYIFIFCGIIGVVCWGMTFRLHQSVNESENKRSNSLQ